MTITKMASLCNLDSSEDELIAGILIVLAASERYQQNREGKATAPNTGKRKTPEPVMQDYNCQHWTEYDEPQNLTMPPEDANHKDTLDHEGNPMYSTVHQPASCSMAQPVQAASTMSPGDSAGSPSTSSQEPPQKKLKTSRQSSPAAASDTIYKDTLDHEENPMYPTVHQPASCNMAQPVQAVSAVSLQESAGSPSMSSQEPPQKKQKISRQSSPAAASCSHPSEHELVYQCIRGEMEKSQTLMKLGKEKFQLEKEKIQLQKEKLHLENRKLQLEIRKLELELEKTETKNDL